MSDVAVVVTTRDRKGDFAACVESLLASDSPPELIVVDQSRDGYAAKVLLGRGKVLAAPPQSLSAARNLALPHVSRPYVLFFDDDARLAWDWLPEAARLLHASAAPFLTGRVTDSSGDPLALSARARGRRIGWRTYDLAQSSATIFRSDLMHAVGGFDHSFGVGARWGGSEETELLLRILRHSGRAGLRRLDFTVIHPSETEGLRGLDVGAAFRRGFAYGCGRGALYRKWLPTRPLWVATETPISFAKAAGKILWSAGSGEPRRAVVALGSLAGRLVGLCTYHDGS